MNFSPYRTAASCFVCNLACFNLGSAVTCMPFIEVSSVTMVTIAVKMVIIAVTMVAIAVTMATIAVIMVTKLLLSW